jgi:hypothetical protein
MRPLPSPALGRRLALLLAAGALAALTSACAEGLSNAPSLNRKWTSDDVQHDVIANGPESCPKEGEDPLAPKGQLRRDCPEAPAAPRGNAPAIP